MAVATEAALRNRQLAQELPPRLLNFFKRYPPPALSINLRSGQAETIQIAENTSSNDPNAPATTTTTTAPSPSPLDYPESGAQKKHSPFLPWKNPSTGNWHGPSISLRRQAELFKLAQKHHVLSLMPRDSPKHPEVRQEKRVEQGLRVQGTGVGRKVKGKLWERTLKGRLQERQRAMERMPEMVRQWKERGHGRGWKKWPK